MDTKTEETGEERGRAAQTPISLLIPCKAEYVGLGRLVAGVIGARESLDEDVIADLKLVVTEACTCFVWRPDDALADSGSLSDEDEDPGSLRIEFRIMPECWQITVSDPEQRRRISSACRCDPLSEGGLGLTIIRALVDEVEQFDGEAGGTVLRLKKRLPARSAPAA